MQRIKISFFLLLLLAVNSFGQEKGFEPGYLLLSSGDTLRGSIKKSLATEHSERVLFRANGKTNTTTYTPEQIDAYFFGTNHYYFTDSVALRDADGDIYFKQLFLRKLLNGSIELYRLDYKIAEEQAAFYQYENRFYFFKESGNNPMIDLLSNGYKIKLNNAFKSKNCELDKTKNYNYTDAGLSNLISEYNKCLGSSSELLFTPKKSKSKLKLGFSAGVADDRIESGFAPYADFEEANNLGYELNFFFELPLWKAIALRGGLQYKHREFNGTQNYIVPELNDNAGEVIGLNADIKINQITSPWQIKADILNGRAKPYLLLGGYFGVALQNTAYLEQPEFRFIDGQSLIVKEGENPFSAGINQFELGWNTGVGFSYDLNEKNSVFLELLRTQGQSDGGKESDFYISQTAYVLLAGFKF